MVKAAKGDTVATIARRYSTSPTNVAQWNKVAGNAGFKTGQSVVVYVPMNAAKAKTGSAQARPKASNPSVAKKTGTDRPKKAKT